MCIVSSPWWHGTPIGYACCDHSSGLHILPVLKELDVPVRAMILPLLNSTASDIIAEAVEEFLVSQT
jgi:hypothetical protein